MGFDCLNDWIGVVGCSGATSNSGVYVNDLPGIELRNIDEIANEEQINFSGVWTAVQKRAQNRFQTDVISMFAKKYKIRMISEGVDIGKDLLTSTTTPSTDYRGFILELNNENDQLVMSNLQVLYIQKLQLYLTGAENTTFKIFDLDSGDELFTSAVTGASGWNEVNVNEVFTARRLFCCYDATLVNSTGLDTTYLGKGCFCSCGVDINGATATIAAPTTVTEGNDAHGFSAVLSVECKYNNLVCNNREVFTQPYLYCLGIELMTETIYSPRMNRWTTTDAKKAKMLRQEFEAKYKGGTIDDGITTMTYSGELSTVVDMVQLDLTDCCLECNQNIMFKDANV